MTRFTLIGAALMMLIPGLIYLLAPQVLLDTPGIILKTTNEFHLVRAAYGGGFLGIAMLFSLGVWRPALSRASLTAVLVLLGGFAFGRLVSLTLDGMPTPLFLGVLAAEVVFATLAWVCLRRG